VIRRMMKEYGSVAFHLMAAAAVFFAWRLLGMPYPGSLGRLIPLELMLTALVTGRGPAPRPSYFLIGLFILLGLFWTAGDGMLLLTISVGVLTAFPGILAAAGRKTGPLRALVPLAPLIISLTLFSGDEPHHATITESFVSPGAGAFGNLTSQHGDPSEGMTHHQKLYPLTMVPGYPFGIPGVRTVNLLFAAFAVLLLRRMMVREGMERRTAGRTAMLGMLMVPGIGILGLVYPGWLAVLIFAAGAVAGSGRASWWKRLVLVGMAAVLLFLIKTRFAGLSIGLLAALAITGKGWRRWSIPLVIVAAVGAMLLLDTAVLGGRLFMARYGNANAFNYLFANVLQRAPSVALGAVSSLVDGESGLLIKAPWLLAAFAGLPSLRRRHPSLFLWLGLPAVSYLAILFLWMPVDWASAPTPVGRLLLPAMPVLLASLAMTLHRRSTVLLVWVSLAMGALWIASPVLRFNYSDGTDVLITMFWGSASRIQEWIPTQVRPALLPYVLWISWAGLLTWLCRFGKGRHLPAAVLATVLCVGAVASGQRDSWEAEDIPPDLRTFCTDYPTGLDPTERIYWPAGMERTLLLGDPLDSIRIPLNGVRPGDTVRVNVTFTSIRDAGPVPGLAVTCGAEVRSVSVESEPLVEEIVTRKDTLMVPLSPGYYRQLSADFELTAGASPCSLLLVPTGVDRLYGPAHGIYLDRVEVR